jgi:hypothetical protein
VIDGKNAVPVVPAGEDEFVELDEEGQPRRKAATRAPRKAANMRRKAPVRGRAQPAAEAAKPVPAAGPAEAAKPEAAEAVEPAAAETADSPDAADMADDDVMADVAIGGKVLDEERSKPAARRRQGSKKPDKGGE